MRYFSAKSVFYLQQLQPIPIKTGLKYTHSKPFSALHSSTMYSHISQINAITPTIYLQLLRRLISSKDKSLKQVKQMKRLLTMMTLSMSALLAGNAMAAPSHEHQNRYDRYEQNRWNHHNDRYDKGWNNNHNDRWNNRVNPSREWRSGQYLPNQFNSSRYAINHKNYRQLPNPGRYQQWYKINGDFVLVNERNNRIVRIIG